MRNIKSKNNYRGCVNWKVNKSNFRGNNNYK